MAKAALLPTPLPGCCLQQVLNQSSEKRIPWILLLLQTNQDLCLSCGRICAPCNLIYWQLPCSSTLLSLFLDAFSASLLTSHAESLHLLWILLKDSSELGSSNRSAVIFIYFWPNFHSSSYFAFHLQHFCSSVHTWPGSECVSEGSQSSLSILAWIPAYLEHLLLPLKAGLSQTEAEVLFYDISSCAFALTSSWERCCLCWMMAYSALCAPLWFYNEDFDILNTLTLEMCYTCLVFDLGEIFWRC